MSGFAELSQYELDVQTIRMLDEAFCRKNEIVLLGRVVGTDAKVVHVGMLDTHRRDVVGKIEMKLKKTVETVQINDWDLDRALDYGFGEDAEEPKTVRLRDEGIREDIRLTYQNDIEFRRGQPVPKIVADMIAKAIKMHSTDIHLERFSYNVNLRFRIDGILRPITTPITLGNITHVTNHIKALADMDVAEHRRPQDGHIVTVYRDAEGDERQIDLRVSTIPGLHGEDIVLRVLDETRMLHNLAELGMSEDVFQCFHDMLHRKSGIILVTGPTSSGKTTTLYSAINHIKNPHNKILTAEDPIEYEIPRVSQKQITERLGFSDYTRVFLRQNPDIIMIGEIRDEDTASVALRASQVGLLILTTLHTKDAPSAVVRMMTLGIDPRLLASGLIGAMSQRLVRKVCQDCREEYQPLKEVLDRMPPLDDSITFTRGAGCDACAQTGYSGMTGVFEVLYFDEQLRRYISQGDYMSEDDIAGKLNYRRLYDDAIDKVKRGITTVEEIDRVVPIPDFYLRQP